MFEAKKGKTYTGRSNILLDFKSLSPYFGLGWSSQKTSGLSVDFEVGALFGAPRLRGDGTVNVSGNNCNFILDTAGVVALSGTVCAAVPPRFRTDIMAGHAELQSSLDNFKIYPVLSLGIRYRF